MLPSILRTSILFEAGVVDAVLLLFPVSSGQSVADTVVGRTSVGFKLLSEGGAFNVFRNTFGATPNEELIKTYACHLSTSTGPIAGTLYLSNLKFAFCSDRPITFNPTPTQQAMSHYKVQASRIHNDLCQLAWCGCVG